MTVPQVSTMDQKSTSTMDYAASEVQSTVCVNDLPPAYQRPISDSLKMAKMVSKTLLALTAILSLVVLMAIYIQANGRGCAYQRSSSSRNGPYFEPLTAESEEKEKKRLPLSIQMAGTAGDLMKKINSKGHVNCVVERKAATQIIASEPKMLMTPFGNITTDPRLIHLSGEKMVFTCKTANKEIPKRNKTKTDKMDLNDNEKEMNETVESRSKRSTYESIKKSECACDCSC